VEATNQEVPALRRLGGFCRQIQKGQGKADPGHPRHRQALGVELAPRPRPTRLQVARFRRLQEIGCIACRLDGHAGTPADIHHLTDSGRRRGHEATIPLCPWHHRGVGGSALLSLLGPSRALHRAAFRARYGEDRALLAQVEALIAALDSN